VLGDVNFMRSLEEFDKDNIPDAVIKKLRRYIDDPNYQPDVVAKQSRAAMSLCMWTRAMDVYNRCVCVCVCVCVWMLACVKSTTGRLYSLY
jgi:dynein heavy chain